MTTPHAIITAVRKVLGPSANDAIDALVMHPAVVAVLDDADDTSYKVQADRVARLAAIAPRYVKLHADAGDAYAKALADEESALDAARKATAARLTAFCVLNGLEAAQRSEETPLREEIKEASSPLINAALVQARNLSMNFISINLDAGKAPPPPKGVPKGFFEDVADVEAPGIRLWQAAKAQQDALIQTLHDALYVALRAAEAAELVEGEFRKMNACLEKLNGAPRLSVDENGNVAVHSPKTGTVVLKAGEVIA